ncbi:hypothetical protein [Fundidesulfovibrio putealis]|uniref:hypothetical protein n=1 Tax=Fundidesulfovibrio putealis TaxID=270496 RepID=UPI0003FD02A5|nr:hypothetical protein [Fundidesulfovibrio putealis]
MNWLSILNEAVQAQGMATVAAALGYRSKSVICEALKGTYKGNLERLEARVLEAFGQPESACCPVLGTITGEACATNRDLAKRLGVRGGNAQTIMLRKACLTCPNNDSNARSNGKTTKEVVHAGA